MQIVVDTMTLVVAEFPDRVNILDESSKGFKSTELVDLVRTDIVNAMLIVQTAPVSGTATSE